MHWPRLQGKDNAKGDAKSIYRGVHKYCEEQARLRVIESPRMTMVNVMAASVNKVMPFDATATGGNGPGWDQEFRQMPKSPQDAENEGSKQRPMQPLQPG
jgi:hypothetical protein